MRNISALSATIFLVAACAPIEKSQQLTQPTGQQLLAGQGDLVARVDKQRDLKNAFGRADIFGRKTDEGFSELRYAGIEPDGTVVLYRRDVEILTNETTMSRSGVSNSFGSANTNVTRFGNTAHATTTGTVTTFGPVSEYHVVVPPQTIPIRLPPAMRVLTFEGYTIEILSASAAGLSYRLRAGVSSQ